MPAADRGRSLASLTHTCDFTKYGLAGLKVTALECASACIWCVDVMVILLKNTFCITEMLDTGVSPS